MAIVRDNVTIENANVVFRNFEGREAQFNSKGDRNFCILLEPELAEILKNDGWNIKYLKPREEEDQPKPYVQVTVNYDKGRPPNVKLRTSRNQQELGATEVAMLDIADVKQWDVVLNPYHWEVNDNKGVKAYLKTAYVTLEEDELELKYAQMEMAKDEEYEGVEV